MVVMAAKWRGTCRVCRCALPPGMQIEWTKEGGARHLSAEECALALANPTLAQTVRRFGPVIEMVDAARPLRGPQPEEPADRARAEHLLLSHPWKTASSMPTIPHSYSLRRLWSDDDDFVWVVDHLQAVGYEELFGSLGIFVYYDIAEYQHWVCGGDARKGPAVVGLINRAVRRPASGRL
jgi:hypothetical protein